MNIHRFFAAALMAVSLAGGLLSTAALAQSLKPGEPAPLQPGINKSVIDNFVGPHYWYFTGGPGPVRVHVLFKAMGLFGGNYTSNVTFSLYDQGRSWHTDKTLSSDSKGVDYTFVGDLKTPTKLLLSVTPPSGGLIRMGGEYQLEAAGNIAYGSARTGDPVVQVYKAMGGYTKDLGSCKFLADGSIQTADGASGHWSLFDQGTRTYVVDIDGQARHSLQYMPGRGLMDGDAIIFQELR